MCFQYGGRSAHSRCRIVAREQVESATVRRRHYLYCIRDCEYSPAYTELPRRTLRPRHATVEARREVIRFEQRFVALDIDINIRIDQSRDRMNPIGAAGKLERSELTGPPIFPAEPRHFLGVGGDKKLIQLGTGSSSVPDPREHTVGRRWGAKSTGSLQRQVAAAITPTNA